MAFLSLFEKIPVWKKKHLMYRGKGEVEGGYYDFNEMVLIRSLCFSLTIYTDKVRYLFRHGISSRT